MYCFELVDMKREYQKMFSGTLQSVLKAEFSTGLKSECVFQTLLQYLFALFCYMSITPSRSMYPLLSSDLYASFCQIGMGI